ncbi:MAG: gamma carbonic anhydrase family protein [Chloroherpetonaceae bacterium]|nr:gamma carbonic anhydrase family protein [Chloroherpetonaceae bacterium]
MPKILPYKGVFPSIDPSVFLAEGSFVIGDVTLGRDTSVWFNAVVRGDVCPIRIGARTNIQDNSTLHVTHDIGPLTIGNNVTIGHNAVLHACTIEDFSLVGMGSILLDDCHLEPYSFVAAGSLVKKGFRVPYGTLVAGTPAKVMRQLTNDELRSLEESAENYIRYSTNYKCDTEYLALTNRAKDSHFSIGLKENN